MFTVKSLRELYSHMEWADARVWSVILGAERASNDEVVKKKLVHIHLVQRVFLNTWTNQPWEAPNFQDIPNLAAVWRWANPYYAEVKKFFASVDHAAVAGVIRETDRAQSGRRPHLPERWRQRGAGDEPFHPPSWTAQYPVARAWRRASTV